ncbi:hypothetical protein OQZ33_18675 [Pedobacter sp. MC2016-05]|uniref:hypothetical protein n=1 Tax=Pedobacter sp. MC2016-05 TaxID=2994474 RepID=UPI002245E40E|nr:hypothetical protein [Pedobacter sp. MC2016-05]MCX2476366.1 hypothetical protein [Pedobacter sp. MC2016-05]
MGNKNKLVHPLFVLSISLLIINDFYLKYIFHNTFTGKLSDFVGLFAFPFFWSVVFPDRAKQVHIGTAVLFCFWKAECAQPVIDFINLFGFKTFRTVDYTDYIALTSVLFSYLCLNRPDRFEAKAVLSKALLFASLFGFVATTQKRDAPSYEDGFKSIDIYNQGDTKLIAIVDFRYSNASIIQDSSLNNEFNCIDTVMLLPGRSERFITPIIQVDSLQFPAGFKITLTDSLGKQIKAYDKELFLKEATIGYNEEKSTEFSSSWSLTIGKKPSENLKPFKIYGRWKTVSSSKNQHTFEIREKYYYDVDPDSELAKYEIRDSTVIITYPKLNREARILQIDNRALTIKWDNKKVLKYEKLYD